MAKHGKPFKKQQTPRPAGRRTLWDQAAAWYDALVGDYGSDYQREIIMPNAWRLLGLKAGGRALDLACGQGVFSRYMAERGAIVEGLDSAAELIRMASARPPAGIVYHTADATAAGVLPGREFDAIACLLAIQNIRELGPLFANVARWLRRDGRLVVVMTHPCFRIPRQSHWGWDDEKKMQYRRVEHYATETEIPILTPPMAVAKEFTITYHRPLQAYIQALAAAQLWVDGMEEWCSNKVSQPGARSRGENRARREIPLFLALRARRAPVE